MEVRKEGFSSQYLKQAQEELLYVQAARECARDTSAGSQEGGGLGYSFRVQVTPDRQVHWLGA